MKLQEPHIVAYDDVDGNFELVIWFIDLDKAVEYFNVEKDSYPDRQLRNIHVFTMTHTSGHDLDNISSEQTNISEDKE